MTEQMRPWCSFGIRRPGDRLLPLGLSTLTFYFFSPSRDFGLMGKMGTSSSFLPWAVRDLEVWEQSQSRYLAIFE